MIDGIGPFFIEHPGRKINWSKIPFEHLEQDGCVNEPRLHRIRHAFAEFTEAVAPLGFNAVSLDDLAHLTDHVAYSPLLRRRIETYQREFDALFGLAVRAGLAPYVTTDIAFFNRDLELALGDDQESIVRFLAAAAERLFKRFPAVRGLIVRLGESDGVDVRSDFRSRLTIRTPVDARRYLRALLTVCEQAGRELIVRTWSIGAYPIGDLMWNPETYRATFDGLDSPRLIVSMKYGETDFFRYVPLAPHFLQDRRHRKLLELQARREYEGFGAFPSFVGGEYARYLRQLRQASDLAGVWVWCQTGGWTAARQVTFVKDSSLWNEINTAVAVRLARDGGTVRAAVETFCRERLPGRDPRKLRQLLRLSSFVVRELWYVDDFARRAVYFRRLRLPPQITVFWDTILITDTVRSLLRHFVRDGRAKIGQGYAALARIRDMQALAGELALPAEGLEFQYRTFEILAVAREYYFGRPSPAVVARLRALAAAYRRDCPGHLRVVIGLPTLGERRFLLRLGLTLLFRSRGRYRLADRLLLLRVPALVRLALTRWSARRLPDVATGQGMTIGHFWR